MSHACEKKTASRKSAMVKQLGAIYEAMNEPDRVWLTRKLLDIASKRRNNVGQHVEGKS